MRRILQCVFFVCCAVQLHGQVPDEPLQFRAFDEKYAWGKATQNQIDSFYYDLQPVERSTYPLHIRFSSSTQFVDLYKTDNQGYAGVLTNTITEYRYEKSEDGDFGRSVPSREVFENVFLDSTRVKTVIEKLFTTGQPGFPTDSLIPGWSRKVFDCFGFSCEYKMKGQYSTQSFMCPWGQNDTISYKKKITSNIDFIYETLRLDTLYDEFQLKLPRGKTYSGNGYTMMYVWTEQQVRQRAKSKPRRDYTDSVKDTIDNYLNKLLASRIRDSVACDCYYGFLLTFGKNGKLKGLSIKANELVRISDYGFADYFAEKRKIRKCRSEIRQLFNGADLGFINGGYRIYRSIFFLSEDGIQIRDETIY